MITNLGGGAYLFHWQQYVSPFFVGEKGVHVVDPINIQTAREYRKAISQVTDLPIQHLIYSHDHRDHIAGGAEIVPDLSVRISAHINAHHQISRRNDLDVLTPNAVIHDHVELSESNLHVEIKYLGPNHSSSNLIFFLPNADKKTVIWVDGVEPGVAPYRNLPDTDFRGLLSTIHDLSKMPYEQIVGGHLGPDSFEWLHSYKEFYSKAIELTHDEITSDRHMPAAGLDGVQATEYVHDRITQVVTEKLQSDFGHWRGYSAWAPMTIDRIISYIITGN